MQGWGETDDGKYFQDIHLVDKSYLFVILRYKKRPIFVDIRPHMMLLHITAGEYLDAAACLYYLAAAF